MGTNFYWKVPKIVLPTGEKIIAPDDMDPAYHIGKRSAAGAYCWDCRVTLCQEGEIEIHSGRSTWLRVCPKCRKLRSKTKAVCSFSWAQDPSRVRLVCIERSGEILIDDENGDEYTGAEFMNMLEHDCPIEFTNSIGKRFC